MSSNEESSEVESSQDENSNEESSAESSEESSDESSTESSDESSEESSAITGTVTSEESLGDDGESAVGLLVLGIVLLVLGVGGAATVVVLMVMGKKNKPEDYDNVYQVVAKANENNKLQEKPQNSVEEITGNNGFEDEIYSKFIADEFMDSTEEINSMGDTKEIDDMYSMDDTE